MVLPGVFHSAVGDVQGLPPGNAQDSGGFLGLGGAVLCAAARAHLPLREIQNASPMAALRHLQQRAAAGLLYIVAVSRGCENVESVRHLLAP